MEYCKHSSYHFTSPEYSKYIQATYTMLYWKAMKDEKFHFKQNLCFVLFFVYYLLLLFYCERKYRSCVYVLMMMMIESYISNRIREKLEKFIGSFSLPVFSHPFHITYNIYTNHPLSFLCHTYFSVRCVINIT